MRPASWLVVGFTLTVSSVLAGAEKPVRIASGVSGHIHPAVCITQKGTIIAIWSKQDYKNLQMSRSSDGGKTWTEPAPVPPTEKLSFYPGSLTLLRDGRIVHCWNLWYQDGDAKDKSRFVQYSISGDDGKTWSEAKSLTKNPKAFSVIRHPFVELSENEWLFSLSDRTIIYDPKTGKETPFADGQKHGLVPIVRTPKGTLVSGSAQRSTDGGRTWKKIDTFPRITSDGWRYDMTCLQNGWLLAGEVLGPGVGGDKWRFIVSRDDGQTWDFDRPYEFYNPGRPIGGRACPKTIQIDKDTIGTLFYDTDAKQPGGSGVFFLRTAIADLGK